MDLTINHGIPEHSYFSVFVPYSNKQHQPILDGKKVIVEFTRDGQKQKAQALQVIKYPLDDMPVCLTLTAHAREPKDLREILIARYPQLNTSAFVTYMVLKKIK